MATESMAVVRSVIFYSGVTLHLLSTVEVTLSSLGRQYVGVC